MEALKFREMPYERPDGERAVKAVHRRAHRRRLRENVRAVSIALEHPADAADLPFDPAQAIHKRAALFLASLGFFAAATHFFFVQGSSPPFCMHYIPLGGIVKRLFQKIEAEFDFIFRLCII